MLKTKPFRALLISILAFPFMGGPTLAGEKVSCPAYTPAMIDAALLAVRLNADRDNIIVDSAFLGPDPNAPGPSIGCSLTAFASGSGFASTSKFFAVYVSHGEFSDYGTASVLAELVRSDVVGIEVERTQLMSTAGTAAAPMTEAEEKACVKAVRESFAWKNYCAPELQ